MRSRNNQSDRGNRHNQSERSGRGYQPERGKRDFKRSPKHEAPHFEKRGERPERRPDSRRRPAPRNKQADEGLALFQELPGVEEAVGSDREDRLEGRNAVMEALRAGRTIDKLWYLEPEGGRGLDPVLHRIVAKAREEGIVVQAAKRATLDRLSVSHNHQGVIAQAAVLPYVEVEDLLKRAADKNEAPFLLVADEIQDSYNLGSLFRIAEAAGVHGIIIPKRRQVGLNAITAKASAGAVNHVPCARVNNLVQALEELKAAGVWIAGTAMDGELLYDNPQLRGPLALIIGNEGKGISPLVRKSCDFMLAIPMKGVLNSLNAAVAAGIAVFEAVRVRSQVKQ